MDPDSAPDVHLGGSGPYETIAAANPNETARLAHHGNNVGVLVYEAAIGEVF